jgi:hypothetical protein
MKTPKQLWALIADIGWPFQDIEAATRAFIKKHGVDVWKELDKFVDARIGELQRAIKEYESEHGQLDIGSDDGFSDVCHHVVGLGVKEFNRCMENPKLVEARYNAPYNSPDGYKESFGYFFLDPMPERTPEDTKNDLKKMIQQADSVHKEIYRLSEVFNKLQMEISQLLNVMGVVKKDLEK